MKTLNKVEASMVTGGISICYGIEDSTSQLLHIYLARFDSKNKCDEKCPGLSRKAGHTMHHCSDNENAPPVSEFVSRTGSPIEYK